MTLIIMRMENIVGCLCNHSSGPALAEAAHNIYQVHV